MTSASSACPRMDSSSGSMAGAWGAQATGSVCGRHSSRCCRLTPRNSSPPTRHCSGKSPSARCAQTAGQQLCQLMQGNAPTTQVGTQLRLLNPTTRQFIDIADPVDHVRDIAGLKPTINQQLEIGYKALVGGRFQISADAWYEKKHNFIGPVIIESPSVFLDRATTIAYLTELFTAGGRLQCRGDSGGDRNRHGGTLRCHLVRHHRCSPRHRRAHQLPAHRTTRHFPRRTKFRRGGSLGRRPRAGLRGGPQSHAGGELLLRQQGLFLEDRSGRADRHRAERLEEQGLGHLGLAG